MLAAVALVLGTCVLVKMKRGRYAWVTLLPTVWLLICTLTAGWQKLFHADPKIGFLSHARKFSDAIAQGTVLAPAKTMEQMHRIVFNDYLDAGLCALFMAVVLSIVYYGLRTGLRAGAQARPTALETPFEPLPAAASAQR